MALYRQGDFTRNEAWLLFPLDTQIKNQSVDVYVVMDVSSEFILGHQISEGDGLPTSAAEQLLATCKKKAGGTLAKRLILPEGDPSKTAFEKLAGRLGFRLEVVPPRDLDDLVAPVRESFGKAFFSPSTIAHAGLRDEADKLDRESAQYFVPGTYEPCPCASGKKFKFCCKPIFRETTNAMIALENGRRAEAIKWLAKARASVGETPEILCREAIVRFASDPSAADQLLVRCLALNPKHPRAHYVRGLALKESGRFSEAIAEYQTAISSYPASDRYHLNETYNNLGTALYESGDFAAAKSAWEKGLALLPSDRRTRDNLRGCIYENPTLPSSLRTISPHVQRYFAS